MRTHGIDAMARRAAISLSRRRSLLTLGGAVVAAPLAPKRLSEARNMKGKACKSKAKRRCKRDIAACKGTVLISCPDPAGCPAAQFCCEGCSASGFIACLIRAQQA